MSKVMGEDWVDNAIDLLRDLNSRIFDIEKEQNMYNHFTDYEQEVDDLIDLLNEGKIKVKEIDKLKQRIKNVAGKVEQLEEKYKMSRKHKFRNHNFHKKEEKTAVAPATTGRAEIGAPTFRNIKAYNLPVILQEGKCELKNKFEVHIEREVYAKLMAQCKLLETEITWSMEAEIRGGFQIYIYDIHLFRQKVTMTTCEAEDPNAQVELMDAMIKAGKNPSNLKVWCHSHNTMATSPSGQDDITSKNYKTKTWMLTLIVNHKGEFFTRLNIYEPIEMQIEDIPVYVSFGIYDEKLIEESKALINHFVRTETYYRSSVPSVYQGKGNNYGYGYPYGSYGGWKDGLDEWPAGADAAVSIDGPQEEGPYGDEFYEQGVKFVWDKAQKKYRMYDNVDRVRELTEEEIVEMGITNWNESLEDDMDDKDDPASRMIDEGGGD